MGDTDIVALAEVPDDIDAMAISLTVASAGHMTSYKTRRLTTPADAMKAMHEGSVPELGSARAEPCRSDEIRAPAPLRAGASPPLQSRSKTPISPPVRTPLPARPAVED